MNGNSGVIAGLFRYAAKGAEAESLDEAVFTECLGMEGDVHATGGERQIALLTEESREWILRRAQGAKVPLRIKTRLAAGSEIGLCFARFKENILTRGIALNGLKSGAVLKTGGVSGVSLEITGETKHCHAECPLFSAGKRCVLAGASLFAKVVKSGVVHVNDPLAYDRRI